MNAHDVFEILAREHADMLVAFVRSAVRDAALVDDIFQDTLLTAWRRLADYDKSRPFGPWLRGIAGNLILAALRQRKKVIWLSNEQVLAHLDNRCEQLSKAPGDTLEEKLELLRDCVQTLPELYRQVIEVRLEADEASSES
ncbi:MAG: polymerase factor sigma-70, partial [Planctomycetaceae bacterium]|nr:polymerase factor sigma-70 [Planctomycetaceae bacterium]